MKKDICIFIAAFMIISLADCNTGNTDSTKNNKQTASAYLDQNENSAVEVTADLSGGWSVEFARGAVYLYDGEIAEGKEATAMLITLDKEVYEEYMAEAMTDENHKEVNGGIYYAGSEAESAYLTSLNDSVFIRIITDNEENIETIVSRFSISQD